jgi:hypothetical protein
MARPRRNKAATVLGVWIDNGLIEEVVCIQPRRQPHPIDPRTSSELTDIGRERILRQLSPMSYPWIMSRTNGDFGPTPDIPRIEDFDPIPMSNIEENDERLRWPEMEPVVDSSKI